MVEETYQSERPIPFTPFNKPQDVLDSFLKWFTNLETSERYLVYAGVTILLATGVLLFLKIAFGFGEDEADRQERLRKKQEQENPRKILQEHELTPYSIEEIEKHTTEEDLWLIIKIEGENFRKVFNVTEYVMEHPGGDSILKYPGKDNTEGFYGMQHPSRVFDMIHDYTIGKVDE